MDNYDGRIVIDTGISTEGFEQGSTEILNAIKTLAASVKDLGDKMSAAFSTLTASLSNFNQGAQGASKAVKRVSDSNKQATQGTLDYQTKITDLSNAVDTLTGRVDELAGKAGEPFKNEDAVIRYAQDVAGLTAELESAYDQLDSLRGETFEAPAFTAMLDTRDQLYNELESLTTQAKELEAAFGGSDAWLSWSPKVAELNDQIAAVKDKITATNKEIGNMIDQGADLLPVEATQEFAALEEKVFQLDDALAVARTNIADERLEQALLNVEVAKEQAMLAQTEAERAAAIQNLRTAHAQLRLVAKELTGKTVPAAKAAASEMRRIGSSSVSAKMHASALTKSLLSLKTMLIGRLKRSFIDAMVSGVQEGIKGLALFSSSFDAAISNIKNSAKELAHNLAVTAGEIIEKVEPIITAIMNGASKVVTYVNSFLAMLQGKSTVKVAKKQTDSYAASLSGAAESAKELNAQVYGFDELNKRASESGKGYGAGSGSASKLGDMYEEVPVDTVVPGGLLDWLEELKRTVTDGNWLGFGSTLASGVNTLVKGTESINFSKATTAINGFIAVVHGFADELDWGMLGEKAANLGNDLVHAFEGINWDEVGETVSSLISGAFETVNTFFEEFDFFGLVETLTTAIGDIINNIDWAKLAGQTLLLMVNVVRAIIQGAAGLLAGLFGTIGDLVNKWGLTDLAEWFYGIKNSVSDISWLDGAVFDPIKNWIKDGLKSEEEAVVAGISGIQKSAASAGAPQAQKQKQERLQGQRKRTPQGTALPYGISTKTAVEQWEQIKQAVEEQAKRLGVSVDAVWDQVRGNTDATWGDIKAAIEGALNDPNISYEALTDIVERFDQMWELIEEDNYRHTAYLEDSNDELYKKLVNGLKGTVYELGSTGKHFIDEGALKTQKQERLQGQRKRTPQGTAIPYGTSTKAAAKRTPQGTALPYGISTKTAAKQWEQIKQAVEEQAKRLGVSVEAVWDQVRGNTDATWGDIKAAIEGALNDPNMSYETLTDIVERFDQMWEFIEEDNYHYTAYLEDSNDELYKKLVNGLKGTVYELGSTGKHFIDEGVLKAREASANIQDSAEETRQGLATQGNGVVTDAEAAGKKAETTTLTFGEKIKLRLEKDFRHIKSGVMRTLEETNTESAPKWTNLKKTAITQSEQTKTGVVNAWHGTKKFIVDYATEADTGASAAFGHLKTHSGRTMDETRQELAGSMSGVKTDLLSTLEQAKTGVSTRFDGIKAKVDVTGDALKTSTSGKWANIKKAVLDPAEQTKTGVSTRFDGIKTKVDAIGDALKTAASAKWANIKKAILDPAEQTKAGISTRFDAVKTKLDSTGDALKTSSSTRWANIKKAILDPAEQTKMGISARFDAVKTKLDSTGDALKTSSSTRWANIKKAILDPAEQAKTGISTRFDGIKAKVDAIGDTLKTTASAKWANLKKVILDQAELTKTGASTRFDGLKAKASEAWAGLKTKAAALFGETKNAVIKISGQIKSEVGANLSGTQTKAASTWNDIKFGATTAWTSIKEIAQKNWKEVKNTFTGGYDIGSNLAKGIESGLSKTWGVVTSTANTLAGKLTNTVKTAFAIASPSKVWSQIGEYLDLGLVKGLQAEDDKVFAAGETIATRLTDRVSGAALMLGAANVASNAFVVPQIATGSVIPARTRISAPGSFEPLYGPNMASMDGVGEQLDDQTYVLRQLLNAVQRLDLNIDVAALSRAITGQQRTHDLNYGGAM